MDTVPTNRTNRDTGLTDSTGGRGGLGESGRRPLGDAERVITGTECNMPGCYRRTSGRFCEQHNSSSLSSPIDDFEPASETSDLFGDPSRRELQRQMDRLEGKLDALLAALELDVDE